MKHLIFVTFLLATSLAVADLLPLIPRPSHLAMAEGTLPIGNRTAVIATPDLKTEAEILSASLESATGFRHRLFTRKRRIPQAIQLTLDPDLPAGHHRIEITPEGATLAGHDRRSLSHAIQTLIRLLPAKTPGRAQSIPCLTITDHAGQYSHRALHLDLGSHLFPVAALKTLVDQLALLKMNALILQFNTPQGWRLEIKKFPKLTSMGATRPGSKDDGSLDSSEYSGHYTQDMMSDLIAYASARHIEIIPSFSLTTGVDAILAAYPELGTVETPRVKTTWDPSDQTLASSETVSGFLDSLMSEVAALFSSNRIHLTLPDKRQKEALSKHKLTLLPEDHHVLVNLAPWQHPPGLVKGQRGAPGLLTLDDVYATPLPSSTQGIRAVLGTQYIADEKALTYTLFPRLAAIAEIAWTSPSTYDNLHNRWVSSLPYFVQRKINVCPPYLRPRKETLHHTRIETSIAHQKDHWAELIFDGRRETYFRSENGLKKNDHITIHFPVPLTGEIEIATGAEENTELNDAVLETSPDGKTWDPITEFFDGVVKITVPDNTRHLRIRVTNAQEKPIVLHELILSETLLVPDFHESRRIELNKIKRLHARISFTCDFTQYPALAEKISLFRRDFFEHYARISDLLGVALLSETPRAIELKFDESSEIAVLNPLTLEKLSPKDARAAFFDYLVTTLAGYQNNSPAWFVSGISSYIQQLYLGIKKTSGEEPLKGSKDTAAFLRWFVENHGEKAFKYLSNSCHNGLYQEKLWEITTNKTLQDLVKAYQE